MASKEGTINITLAAHDNNFSVWKGYIITLNYAHNCHPCNKNKRENVELLFSGFNRSYSL